MWLGFRRSNDMCTDHHCLVNFKGYSDDLRLVTNDPHLVIFLHGVFAHGAPTKSHKKANTRTIVLTLSVTIPNEVDYKTVCSNATFSGLCSGWFCSTSCRRRSEFYRITCTRTGNLVGLNKETPISLIIWLQKIVITSFTDQLCLPPQHQR